MRTLLLSALFVCAAGMVMGADHDIEQMMARLAAQEARMAEQSARMQEQDSRIADLNAKLAANGESNFTDGKPEGVVSLQKNGVVTIGGLVNTRYSYTNAKVDSVFDHNGEDDGNYMRRARSKSGSLEIADAELHIQVDVNEHVEAFINVNLHNGGESDFYNAESYYIRWKDICNTGFGVLVGRDALVFGQEGFGELDSYAAGPGSGLGDTDWLHGYGGFKLPGDPGDPDFAVGGIIPTHNGWDISGVTQITPYWEGFDGKLKVEVSLFQNVYDDTPHAFNSYDPDGEGTIYRRDRGGYRKYRSKNYGVGSFTSRVTWTPIEDLNITGSFGNYRNNDDGGPHTKNNIIYGLAFNWRPCFFDRLYVWGQWIHGNNVWNHSGMTSDVLNFGAAFDLTESLTVFAQGDWLRTKYDFGNLDQKGTAWAVYAGVQYTLPYGAFLEAGWRHEQIKWKDRGVRYAKAKADTIYAQCGFEF